MKNIRFFIGALAIGALALTACDKKDTKVNVDDIVEDGFYVVGEATAVESATAANAAKGLMGAGINEVDKTARAGLYEKYVALEGGKEFELVLKEGKNVTHYGAKLESGEPYDVAYGVTIPVLKGALEENIKMTVSESGFYHIALDLNVNGDLPEASIIVAPVQWQINASSDMTMTASSFNKEKMTWTLKDVEMKKGAKYKYAYGNGWKIKVTPAAEVNIETNLGQGMKPGADDIVIPNSGKYTFELVWTLAGGNVEKSFTDNTKCTEQYEEVLPDNVYVIGNFCGWAWENALPMVRMYDANAFWAIRYIKPGAEDPALSFKFSTTMAWDGNDFTNLGSGINGAVEKDGNLVVETEGLYLIYLDYDNGTVSVEPAQVYGIGSAFNDETWSGIIQEERDGEKVVVNVVAEGELRMFAGGAAFGDTDWWKHEFVVLNGEIAYRGNGGDQERVQVAAGQKVTLDFNTGKASIQ